jgi:hypothetical protein
LGYRVKKTVDGRKFGSHISRCDGEPHPTPEKKQAAQEKGNKEPQKRTEAMVFEQEKVSHAQEPNSDMREFENDYRCVCRLWSQERFCYVEKINRRESSEAHKNPSGQGLYKGIYDSFCIGKLHENSETPKKKTKKRPLTKEEKASNRRINSERVGVEHTNCRLKRFHILDYPYRNRRKRFGLRLSLFCGYTTLNSLLIWPFLNFR